MSIGRTRKVIRATSSHEGFNKAFVVILQKASFPFKRKSSFLQNNYKSLAKAACELVALVILRVPPVLTVALLNLFLS